MNKDVEKITKLYQEELKDYQELLEEFVSCESKREVLLFLLIKRRIDKINKSLDLLKKAA